MSLQLACQVQKLACTFKDPKRQRCERPQIPRHPEGPAQQGSNGNVASTMSIQRRQEQQQPPPDLWGELLYQLRKNKLVELRLGWHDSVQIPSVRSLSLTLAKALQNNTSLRRISLGWCDWSRRPDLLRQLLLTFAESIQPDQLESIQLVLTHNCIPARLLMQLLRKQTSLSSLRLQTVRVSTTTPTTCNDISSPSRVTTVVPVLLHSLIPHYRYKMITELSLMDCDLDDEAVMKLAQVVIPATSLSIRGNRRVSGYGAAALIRAQKSSCLDLSICDFGSDDCIVIAQALQDLIMTSITPPSSTATPQTTLCLQQLLFRGNYRMELAGLHALMAVAPYVVLTLDMSYCDLSEDMTIHIFNTLAEMGTGNTKKDKNEPIKTMDVKLRHLSLHGCHIGGTRATDALVALLGRPATATTTKLRSLALGDDKNKPKYVSSEQMLPISEAMSNNYEMERLTFDFFKSRDEQRVWRDIEFWQVLNRAGRRLLCPANAAASSSPSSSSVIMGSNNSTSRDGRIAKAQRDDVNAWIRLLDAAKMEPGLESVFWVVRNSVERFSTNNRC